nr:sigma 54-interacting transcriptional regulator [Polyangium aurulentum]
MTAEYLQHDSNPPSQTRTVRQGAASAEPRIVGGSAAIQDLVRTLHELARSRGPVLVTGESGTGKGHFAHALHQLSPRRERPFVRIACEGPEAKVDHEALLSALANTEGGTLFVDGIEHLSADLQDQLLTVITSDADVRVVASASRPLHEAVEAGRFRADLHALFSEGTLRLPSLGERVEDIPALARHFFDAAVARLRRSALRGISPEAMAVLEGHAWTDNVRGLERAIEQAVTFAEGPYVTASDLPEELRQPLSSANPRIVSTLPAQGMDLRAAVEEFETRMILQALERTGWNKNRAARLLGLNRTTLVEMIKRKRLAPPLPLRGAMSNLGRRRPGAFEEEDGSAAAE